MLEEEEERKGITFRKTFETIMIAPEMLGEILVIDDDYFDAI